MSDFMNNAATAAVDSLGLDLPLEPVRRQKVFISPKPQIPLNAPLTIDLVEDAYWRPETGGAYIAWVDPDEPAGEPAELAKATRLLDDRVRQWFTQREASLEEDESLEAFKRSL